MPNWTNNLFQLGGMGQQMGNETFNRALDRSQQNSQFLTQMIEQRRQAKQARDAQKAAEKKADKDRLIKTGIGVGVGALGGLALAPAAAGAGLLGAGVGAVPTTLGYVGMGLGGAALGGGLAYSTGNPTAGLETMANTAGTVQQLQAGGQANAINAERLNEMQAERAFRERPALEFFDTDTLGKIGKFAPDATVGEVMRAMPAIDEARQIRQTDVYTKRLEAAAAYDAARMNPFAQALGGVRRWGSDFLGRTLPAMANAGARVQTARIKAEAGPPPSPKFRELTDLGELGGLSDEELRAAARDTVKNRSAQNRPTEDSIAGFMKSANALRDKTTGRLDKRGSAIITNWLKTYKPHPDDFVKIMPDLVSWGWDPSTTPDFWSIGGVTPGG